MELEFLKVIGEMISKIGLVNTLIAIVIMIVVGYLYRNKSRSNKVLTDTVQTQQKEIITAIDNQNTLLVELQRTTNSISESIREFVGKLDGFMVLVVGLVQRDVDKGGE